MTEKNTPEERCAFLYPHGTCGQARDLHRSCGAISHAFVAPAPIADGGEIRCPACREPMALGYWASTCRCGNKKCDVGVLPIAFVSEIAALRAEVERLRHQLPQDMENCTIRFNECEKGHGWLTATNWVPIACPTCRAEKAERERANWKEEAGTCLRERDTAEARAEKLAAALGDCYGYAAPHLRQERCDEIEVLLGYRAARALAENGEGKK